MNVILYSAEQLLSHGHAELIHHLYNARILLDEYLRKSMHNGHTIFMDKLLFAIYIFSSILTLIMSLVQLKMAIISALLRHQTQTTHLKTVQVSCHVCVCLCEVG